MNRWKRMGLFDGPDIEKATAQLNAILDAYNEEINVNGKRALEAIAYCEKSIEHLERTLKGKSEDGMIALLNFGAGYKEVPAEGTEREDPINQMIARLSGLQEIARKQQEYDPCTHEMSILSWFRGGLSPASVDVKCNVCDSVQTWYNAERISELLLNLGYVPDDAQEIFRCKTEQELRDIGSDNQGLYMTYTKVLRNLTEHGIPEERHVRDLIYDLGLREE